MASRRFASSTPGGGEELSDSVRPTGGSRRCQVRGCNREYRRTRHAHCCSFCTFGRHSTRCNNEWNRFCRRRDRARRDVLRGSLTICDNSFCRRVAGLCHTRCCSLCTNSQGREHTGSCNERQGFVYVSGGAAGSEEGNGSLHQDSQGVSTAVGAGGTPWCTGTSTAADAESPDPDHGRPGSSTDAGASQTGEMVLGMGMGMGTHTIFILDSDEEADIARAIAASLEGPTVDASMNDFSLEEMD